MFCGVKIANVGYHPQNDLLSIRYTLFKKNKTKHWEKSVLSTEDYHLNNL